MQFLMCMQTVLDCRSYHVPLEVDTGFTPPPIDGPALGALGAKKNVQQMVHSHTGVSVAQAFRSFTI